MKFERTEVWGFEHALRGMRNPMNSWDRSDSHFNCNETFCNDCANGDKNPCGHHALYIGENDLKLAQKLIRAGSEHRKFMRQIFVSVDITAPMFWFSEFDTYKIGTVANSTSKMHKLTSQPITIECFETDDMTDVAPDELINRLEQLRIAYLETKDKRYWKELLRWLPESWLQTRTVTLNYENLYSMVRQRANHKLNEWSGKDNPELPNFISWVRSLPYAQELIFVDFKE